MIFLTVADLSKSLKCNASRLHNAIGRGEIIKTKDGFIDTEEYQNSPYLLKLCKAAKIDPVEFIPIEFIEMDNRGELPKARKDKARPEEQKNCFGKSRSKIKTYAGRGAPSAIEKMLVEQQKKEAIEGKEIPKKRATKKAVRKKSTQKKTEQIEENTQEISAADLQKMLVRKQYAEAELKEEMLRAQKIKNEKLRGDLVEKEVALQMYAMTYESIRSAIMASVGKNIGERYHRAAVVIDKGSDLAGIQEFNKIHAAVMDEVLKEATNIFELQLNKMKLLDGVQ